MLRLLPLLLLCTTAQGFAQQVPETGVVYAPASTYEAIAEDFRQMRAAGVDVVRMPPVGDDRLLTLADTLGLSLYQELPYAYLTGARTRAQGTRMDAALTELLTRSRGHASARTFGLARRPDTGDPRVCEVLRDLAQRVRAEQPGARVYYVAPFAERDRCAQAVDFVLLPALDAPDPAAVLERWQAANPATPAGLVVGWSSEANAQGIQNARSPEWAATQLDTVLTRYLTPSAARAPLALLVYRWRDAGAPHTDLQSTAQRPFGLLDGDVVRPAYEVVRGHFTGTRDVFALRSRASAPHRPGGLVVLSWLMVGLLGWVMRREPRVRQMATRYFTAHGFYRESIRDGREALGLTTFVLSIVTGLSIGVIGAVVLESVYRSPAFGLFVDALPPGGQQALGRLLEAPVLLALTLMVVFLVVQIVQAIAYALAVRRRAVLSPLQPLALSLWSHWPLLPLAFAALVVQTLPAPYAVRGIVIVSGLTLLVEGWALLRTLVDLKALTRIPAYMGVALLLVHPVVLGAVVLAVASLDYGSAYAFFLRLARNGIG